MSWRLADNYFEVYNELRIVSIEKNMKLFEQQVTTLENENKDLKKQIAILQDRL